MKHRLNIASCRTTTFAQMLVGAIIGALSLNAFADTQVLVLDIVRASEVLDQINEDTPGAFDDWINRLEAETDKFTQLVTHLTAGADVPSVGARKKSSLACIH